MSKEYDKLWQKVVCHRAQNRCQLNHEGCTDMAYNGAHHIIPRKEIYYRWDENNGFAVCPSCHQWIEEHPKEFMDLLIEWEPHRVAYLRWFTANRKQVDDRKKEMKIEHDKAELEMYCWSYGI